MPAASAILPIKPSSASISRTRWPLPKPPIAGLQDISPMVSRRCVSSRVRAPSRAAAAAASQPACPPPITMTSKEVMTVRYPPPSEAARLFHVKHSLADAEVPEDHVQQFLDIHRTRNPPQLPQGDAYLVGDNLGCGRFQTAMQRYGRLAECVPMPVPRECRCPGGIKLLTDNIPNTPQCLVHPGAGEHRDCHSIGGWGRGIDLVPDGQGWSVGQARKWRLRCCRIQEQQHRVGGFGPRQRSADTFSFDAVDAFSQAG